MKIRELFEDVTPEFEVEEISHEPDGIMALVMSDTDAEEYYGVNVLIKRGAKEPELITDDPVADEEATKYRDEIIAAVKNEISDHEYQTILHFPRSVHSDFWKDHRKNNESITVIA